MDASEKDEILSDMYHVGSPSRKLSPRTQSASMSAPRSPIESYEIELQRSGAMPSDMDAKLTLQDGWAANHGAKNEHFSITCSEPWYSLSNESKAHNVLSGDAKGWARRMYSHLLAYIPGVMNPHARIIQQWNKCFVISCLFSIFLDPLFLFLLSVQQDNKCILINRPFTTTFVSFRTLADLIYLMNVLLQFRLAYVAYESRGVGGGDLIDDPKKIALNYLKGYFIIDFFVVLPLPQIVILLFIGSSGANYAKNLLLAAVLIPYVPRLCRFFPFLTGRSPSGFIFESSWENFVIDLLTVVFSWHIVGSSWYLLGLQRVNQCLRDACHHSGIENCNKFIDCGHGNNTDNFRSFPTWKNWTHNVNAISCFNSQGSFPYGIYAQAVNLTAESSIVTRYIYAFFWGFQQISTLAGNQIPSYFVWEVLFTMGIIGVGLVVFAFVIGNMQNFLLTRRNKRLEMSLQKKTERSLFEEWMRHRRIPEDLRRQVRQAERYNWVVTRGVNEEKLLENLPEDLQRELRRHRFNFIKKVRIFAMMDEPILDAICAKLRQKTYIRGSRILDRGGLIDKMVFIVRGKMESIGDDNITVLLSEGDVCGVELLTWCLEQPSVNKDGKKVRRPGPRLLSNRMIMCVTNVEAFTLQAADLEEVTHLFSRFLRNARVQGALRYDSPYRRCEAAKTIQIAWRYRKRRLQRAETFRK